MALLDGSTDALMLVSAPESLMVQMLLQTPGVKLFDFAQAEAYSRRFPFMSPVVLPRGVVDLARDMPPADVRLVAPTAALVARAGTHPALVQLFVQAAAQVHGGAGWFQRKGDFPNTRDTERPLADEAQRYYAEGVPLLQRYLPFWLANLIDRMWPVLVSLLAILLPLSRALPPLYEFRIRSRIFRWYAQLRDDRGGARRAPGARAAATSWSARRARRAHRRAAELRRRAVRAAQPHQPGAPAAAGRGRDGRCGRRGRGGRMRGARRSPEPAQRPARPPRPGTVRRADSPGVSGCAAATARPPGRRAA